MDEDERVVRDSWAALGGGPGAADDLVARHREPHRRYHTVIHVAWVLRRLDELLAGVQVDDNGAVRAAALFHDAVYDPRTADNEARSADLAADALSALGWPASRIDVVRRLILATAGHDATDDSEGALLDADLSILGSPRSDYERYVRAVRAEYAHVDDAGWRSGRGAVLRSFLDRDRIYATDVGRARFEQIARRNLTAELSSLQ